MKLGVTAAEAAEGIQQLSAILRGARPPDGTIRCWWCGAEPLETYDVTTLGQAKPSYIAGRWPPGDHQHAQQAPTPGQLEQAGHEALTRIRHEATTT